MAVAAALFACVDFFNCRRPPGLLQFVWMDSGVSGARQGLFYEASTLATLRFFPAIIPAFLHAASVPADAPVAYCDRGSPNYSGTHVFVLTAASLVELAVVR